MNRTRNRSVLAALVAALAALTLTLAAPVEAAPAAPAGTYWLNGTSISVKRGSTTIVGLEVRGGSLQSLASLRGKTIRLAVTNSTRIAALGRGVVSSKALEPGQTLLVKASVGSPTATATYKALTIMIFA